MPVAIVRSATTVGVTVAERRAARKAVISSVTISRTAATSVAASPSLTSSASRASPNSETPGSSATAGSHVVGQRQVDDGQRTPGALPRAGHDGQRQDHAGRAGARDQQVGVGQLLLHGRERDRPPVVLLGEAAGAGVGAARDHDLGGAEAAHRGDGEAGHRAGADDQDALALDRADLGGRATERKGDEGGRGPLHVGLRVHALADPQGLLEEHVERGAHGAGLLAHPQRVPDLPEDLALADHHRVETRGHPEGVGDGAVVVVDVEVGHHVLGSLVRDLAEQPRHRLDAAVEAVDLGVHLDPVARGQGGRLEDVLARHHVVHQLVDAVGVEREPLEHRDGRGLVGDPHHQHAHSAPGESGAKRASLGCHAPTTPSSSMPSTPCSASALRCSW